MITIEFRTIDYESRTTKYLIDWEFTRTTDTIIPRVGEFIMLPKDLTACAKKYKYEIKNILRESIEKIVCYVIECDYKNINFPNDDEKNRKKI